MSGTRGVSKEVLRAMESRPLPFGFRCRWDAFRVLYILPFRGDFCFSLSYFIYPPSFVYPSA